MECQCHHLMLLTYSSLYPYIPYNIPTPREEMLLLLEMKFVCNITVIISICTIAKHIWTSLTMFSFFLVSQIWALPSCNRRLNGDSG